MSVLVPQNSQNLMLLSSASPMYRADSFRNWYLIRVASISLASSNFTVLIIGFFLNM